MLSSQSTNERALPIAHFPTDETQLKVKNTSVNGKDTMNQRHLDMSDKINCKFYKKEEDQIPNLPKKFNKSRSSSRQVSSLTLYCFSLSHSNSE